MGAITPTWGQVGSRPMAIVATPSSAHRDQERALAPALVAEAAEDQGADGPEEEAGAEQGQLPPAGPPSRPAR